MKSPRIEVNSEIMFGKPIIIGTRIPVELILDKLAAGESEAEILIDYPRLTKDDILAALDYASNLVKKVPARSHVSATLHKISH